MASLLKMTISIYRCIFSPSSATRECPCKEVYLVGIWVSPRERLCPEANVGHHLCEIYSFRPASFPGLRERLRSCMFSFACCKAAVYSFACSSSFACGSFCCKAAVRQGGIGKDIPSWRGFVLHVLLHVDSILEQAVSGSERTTRRLPCQCGYGKERSSVRSKKH